jgi:actin-like ATPase involved in cell morphogenesis
MNLASEKNELSRYIIGIDLGTTNSAVAFVDTARKAFTVEDFKILQVSASAEISSLNLFPSFHYEAAQGEFSPGALHLPWEKDADTKRITGVFARDHGAQVPGRLIVSSKSWLSHSGVDRTAPLLPWHALPDVEKISPVETTSRYLQHMRNAWNYDHPDYLMENQDVIITVPASFDEIARELTVEAASQAGLKKIILLEEPQAAFYAWIQNHSRNWQTFVNAGQKILICDIGGGTTDFTLIQVRSSEDGSVQFHRIAVGDHLILGGDNLDLALAYYIEQHRLSGRKITPRQFGSLVRSCQKAKEVLLGENAPQKLTMTIPGTGASVIGGAIQVELDLQELQKILIDGYFPYVDINEKPSTRLSGFQEFGLPYAPDPAITKYLAAFLIAHSKSSAQFSNSADPDQARPDIVLFNGGVFGSTAIRDRILDVLQKWFSVDNGSWKPIVFENDHPERAVARGASYFGLVRRGGGVRIAAGLARSYYIGVETSTREIKALCLAPAGLQEGQSVDLESRTFTLLIRQPVEFPLYVSSRRTTDASGELIDIDSTYTNFDFNFC